VVKIMPGERADVVAAAITELRNYFEPFWKTPSGKARALIVLLQFCGDGRVQDRVAIAGDLRAAVARGEFCDTRSHRLGLLCVLPESGTRLENAKSAIDMARRCQLTELALDGPVLRAAHDAISLPGLLNQFEEIEVTEIQRYAAEVGIHVVPKLQV